MNSQQHPKCSERGDKPAKKYRPAYHLILIALLLNPLSAVAEVVGGRPAGCPARFCGCASAKYLGIKHDGRLNLARNWLRFPRAEPGPGMAVVRNGHVAIIIGGSHGRWVMFDPNSGRGLTRKHVRPLFGKVVNPRAFAEAQ